MSRKGKYNQNSHIRAGIRRVFSRSPLVQEVLHDVRSEHDKYNKNGILAKNKSIRYQCAVCHREFMKKDVAVDHISPVIPEDGKFTTWDDFVNRLFCDKSNLQVLCAYKLKDKDKHDGKTSCHYQKTQKERNDRKMKK